MQGYAVGCDAFDRGTKNHVRKHIGRNATNTKSEEATFVTL